MLDKDLENKSIEELKEMLKNIRANRRLKPEVKKGGGRKKAAVKEPKLKIDIDSIPDEDLKGLL